MSGITNIVSVNPVKFDNEPFVRSLTASMIFLSTNPTQTLSTWVSAPDTYLFSWVFNDTTIWATQINGEPYISNTILSGGAISTIIFYLTAGSYDPVQTPFTLLTETISGYYRSSLDTEIIAGSSYDIVYDLFPNIPTPILFLNYENTNFSRVFYREVSNTPYDFRFTTLLDEYFFNKINYILKSEDFANALWTASNLTVNTNAFPAPNNTYTATLLQPVTGLPYNTIKQIGNFQNTDYPRPPGTQRAAGENIIPVSEGIDAEFDITINSQGTVEVIDIINGGYNYINNDLIRINNSIFPGLESTAPSITFNVLETENLLHGLQQTVPLSAGRYTFSLYAYPSADGRFIYFRTSTHGDIIFDLYGTNIYNYGSWELGSVVITNPSDFFLSAFDLGNNWVRCTASLNLSSDEILDFDIGVTTTTISPSSDAGETDIVVIWGAQIEPGGTATAYTSTDSEIFTREYNTTKFLINNDPTPINFLSVNTTIYSAVCSFDASFPCVSSIQIVISANSTYNSLTSWYTPHIYVNSISAKFIPAFLTADFIGYPSVYFDASGTGLPVDSFNYTTTNGLCFYGEGHTEKIVLSASEYINAKYFWNFLDPNTNVYENIEFGLGTDTPLITSLTKDLQVNVPTVIGYYPSIPISLFITNDYILSSGPIYKLNDITGEIEPYPFFYSTVLTISGNEIVAPYNNPNNNPYKRDIQVVSYAPVLTSFSTEINNELFLPVDSSIQILSSELVTALFGGGSQSIDKCYDKYNLIWKWSELSGCSVTPSSFVNKPSSWFDVQCSQTASRFAPYLPIPSEQGRYPKRWRFEGFNTDDGIIEAEYCWASNVVWTLSTNKWTIETTVPITERLYEIPLAYFNDGSNFYTISKTENTDIEIRGEVVVTCTISAFPFDWGVKTSLITDSSKARILSPGDFKFYTSNRFVLTGTEVKFQNLSKGFNRVSNITIDFDNDTPFTLTNENLYSNFSTVYTEPGYKTLTVTVSYDNGGTVTESYKNILNVVSVYDTVDPINYRTPKTELLLPWPQKPYIAPNEWVTENNINSVIKKFYENLEYLETRGRSYYDSPVEFYGWLGVPVPPASISACPVWAWEDVECGTLFVFESSAVDTGITWADVEQLDTNIPEITASGRLAECGPWEQHFRKSSTYNPDCFGRHCVEWKWKSRRSNNLANITTWVNTKFGQVYEKKWYQEPCITLEGDVITGLNCDEGLWQVNIPKINEYFNPITQCTDNANCSYRNITTYNDLIVIASPTQIKVLSSEYDPSFIASKRTIDDFFAFKNIKNIEFDSTGKLFVLDGTLNRVAVYNFDITSATPWERFLDWGGFGSSNSRNKFSAPNDLHVDQTDNIWVADTGNNCIKHYTNTGTWIQTIKYPDFVNETPISIVVDSSNQIHALVNNKVIVFSYNGNYLFEYILNEFNDTTPTKLSVNQNREIVYVVSNKKVGKYFRNGAFAGFVVQDKICAENITSVHQDKYRNVLITSGEKILKYVDPMRIKLLKGPLPKNYWNLNDILIHKDEYVQDWVYNKAFQRLWDNIELFRRSLVFELDECQKYIPPKHNKDEIILGQNEIVTAASVNRVISFLWENFTSIVEYFDPNCLFRIQEQQEEREESIRAVALTTTGISQLALQI